jgi:hypothetical protein
MVEVIPDAELGFTLVFSAQPFPGFQVEFEWRRGDLSGNWYYCSALEMKGWLYPALFKYFDSAPKNYLCASSVPSPPSNTSRGRLPKVNNENRTQPLSLYQPVRSHFTGRLRGYRCSDAN